MGAVVGFRSFILFLFVLTVASQQDLDSLHEQKEAKGKRIGEPSRFDMILSILLPAGNL